MRWISRYLFFFTVGLISTLLLIVYFSASQGGYDYSGQVIGRDFLNTFTGGLLISEGRWGVLYDARAYWDELKLTIGQDYPVHYWSYPPLLWPVSQFLSVFPYFVAYAIWTGFGVALVFWAVWLLGLRWFWGVFICLSPAGFFNIIAGQNGYILSSLMMIALSLTFARKPALAGLSWAILAFKPHLGVCILPMLIGQKRFRTIAWGGVFLALVLALTILAYGLQPWELFFSITSTQQVHVIETWGGAIGWMVPTGFMQGRLWEFDASSAYVLHASVAGIAVVLLALSWPGQQGDVQHYALWLVSGTLVILPYSFVYDFVMLQFAVALWFERDPRAVGERTRRWQPMLLGCLWLAPWLGPWFARFHDVQIVPVILLFLLYQMAKSKTE